MSTTPRNPGSGPEDEYPEDASGLGTDGLSELDSLDGPEDPGTVDPFQDPDYLAEQLLGADDVQPGTGDTAARDVSSEGQDGTRAAQPDAGDLEADGSGSDASSGDEDRFDAG
ncbi:hypothetical protein OIU93_06790 [Paeniglutamicibacter sp. ZC-3]|uniref:hypothetical protein n=1 Tax=Paeniglutamicibacter sp. ZC-3 TaxID=2986919 RepID=UPI0021F6AD47|nr:hypothetical protein [Paeniglutamicibacter sp. ZC-3]MCV9994007.1 hypothetical protein [Paeniglutamicibacter sp. ZC-3]